MGNGSNSFELDIEVAPDPIDGGFVARVRQHPGAMSQGDTEEEAVGNAFDAFLCLFSATMGVGVTWDEDVLQRSASARTHRVAELV